MMKANTHRYIHTIYVWIVCLHRKTSAARHEGSGEAASLCHVLNHLEFAQHAFTPAGTHTQMPTHVQHNVFIQEQGISVWDNLTRSESSDQSRSLFKTQLRHVENDVNISATNNARALRTISSKILIRISARARVCVELLHYLLYKFMSTRYW